MQSAIVKGHGKIWNSMGDRQKRKFDGMASVERSKKARHLADAIEESHARVAVLQSQL